MFFGLRLLSFPLFRFICCKPFTKFSCLCFHRKTCLPVSCLKLNFHPYTTTDFKMPPKRTQKAQKKESESDECQHSSMNGSSSEEEEEVASKVKRKKAEKKDKKKVETVGHAVSEDESQSDSESKVKRIKKKQIEKKVESKKAEKSGRESDASDVDKNEESKKAATAMKKTEQRGAKRVAGGKGDASNKKAKVEPASNPQLKDLNFDCEKTTPNGEKWNYKISTWNVAGLRAWLKKGGIDYIKKENPDIICLQETKCSEKKLPPEAKLAGYHTHWANSIKEGYAGVALYSKEKPISIKKGIGKKEHDAEGRLITAEFEKFYLVTTYVPNAGQGLKTLPKRMQWDPDFRDYLKKLDSKKPVILCGDLNVAHNEIDLANPKTNTKSAGFTKEERDGMTSLLKEGFVDTFRHLYPDQKGAYTFWSYFNNARARNTGWRLDYFILSERFMPHLCDNVIRSQVYGSDHCPVTLFLHI